MRLIDGNRLLNLARSERDTCGKDYDFDGLLSDIENAPTVDAVPVVHGRWQWLSSTYDRTPCEMRYMCDKCRHETITHEHKPWEKYCPNCGAKMDLEE